MVYEAMVKPEVVDAKDTTKRLLGLRHALTAMIARSLLTD
jgi:histidyl-tRNA synthetase